MPSTILVIKLGALGDFVQALGPMTAIRRHHSKDRVVLLTAAPFAAFAEASTLFDDIWIDERPHGRELHRWLDLRRRLRDGAFDKVYDLQTSDRSSLYFRLFWPGPYPEWSGIAKGCSHPHANPNRDDMHTIERQREQLEMAGIALVPVSDLSWAADDLTGFSLQAPFALLAAGGARHRPAKRWPETRYAKIAVRFLADGVQPVFIGGPDETDMLAKLTQRVPGAINLAGRTSLAELATLGREALCAVGNDTGPMHLLAMAGCASIVLYSDDSDPALCAQRGPQVHILRVPSLADLPVNEVWTAIMENRGDAPLPT